MIWGSFCSLRIFPNVCALTSELDVRRAYKLHTWSSLISAQFCTVKVLMVAHLYGNGYQVRDIRSTGSLYHKDPNSESHYQNISETFPRTQRLENTTSCSILVIECWPQSNLIPSYFRTTNYSVQLIVFDQFVCHVMRIFIKATDLYVLWISGNSIYHKFPDASSNFETDATRKSRKIIISRAAKYMVITQQSALKQ